jgi:type IV secretory pathway protease TraF
MLVASLPLSHQSSLRAAALLWNASDSVPVGLYFLRPADSPFLTELLGVQPPEPLATFLDLTATCRWGR